MSRKLHSGIVVGAVALAALAGVRCNGDGGGDPLEGLRADLGVFVLVVDGLRPSEVGAPTPNLTAFRDDGTWYEESRSVMIAETVPNHVAMMTGVYPDRSGIPANTYWSRSGTPEGVDLSDPVELEAPTLFTILADECRPNLTTAAVLSKKYLFEIFSAGGVNVAPDSLWDPRPTNIPLSEHSPDVVTMDEALARLPDTDFMFVNLGDVDREGHADFTGPGPRPALRTQALVSTDAQIGRFLSALRDAGRWERSVVIIVSDHGFDWSTPLNIVNLQPALPAGLAAIQNGGADNIYVVDPDDPQRDSKLAQARAAALAHPGVEAAWYRQPNSVDTAAGSVLPAELHAAHENIGDLVVVARTGWRCSDPDANDNPIPGNHGHLVTRHNTFMIGGGAPFVARDQTIAASQPNPSPLDALAEQSENLDVAPTVAWLLGLDTGRFDGRVLTEAFTVASSPSRCGVTP